MTGAEAEELLGFVVGISANAAGRRRTNHPAPGGDNTAQDTTTPAWLRALPGATALSYEGPTGGFAELADADRRERHRHTIAMTAVESSGAQPLQPSQRAVRAFGSAIGVTVLSLFGAAWIFLSLISQRSAPALYVPAVLATLLLLWGAATILRRNAAEARSSTDPRFRRKIGRVFGIVNAVQWTLVFIAATLLGRYGLSELVQNDA